MFYSILIDGISEEDTHELWTLYYHLYVNKASLDVLQRQIKKLVEASGSQETWRASPYGSAVKFCDAATFSDFRSLLTKYTAAIESADDSKGLQAFRSSLNRSSSHISKGTSVITGFRSGAPCGIQACADLPEVFRHFWETGTTDAAAPKPGYPNPLFSSSVSQNVLLHYGTDPTLGFHLAAAYAPLAQTSPIRIGEKVAGAFKSMTAARAQFSEWSKALREKLLNKSITLRFITADALAFGHTLQHCAATGELSAHWYRRQMEMKKLELDLVEYGPKGNAPRSFNAIDTSNLADHVGALNLLVAAGPLLRAVPSSTLFTELLIRREASTKDILDKILCGHAPTMSLLLGLGPVEYLTNATASSSADEMLLNTVFTYQKDMEGEATQLRTTMSWKTIDQFSGLGRGGGRVAVEPLQVAEIFLSVYQKMFHYEDAIALVGAFNQHGRRAMNNSAYPHFHRGSLVAILKLVKSRVITNWDAAARALFDKIANDKTLMLGSNYIQELGLHMHMAGLLTADWLVQGLAGDPTIGGFSAWKPIPELVAVTLVVPREALGKLFASGSSASPTLEISMRSSMAGPVQFQNLFADLQLGFGILRTKGSRTGGDFTIAVDADSMGWEGKSPVVASFYAPAAALLVEPKTAFIALHLQQTMQNVALYSKVVGSSLSIYETTLGNEQQVFITKHLPGQAYYPVICDGTLPARERKQGKEMGSLSLSVDDAMGKATAITSHIDITSKEGKTLLAKQLPVEMRQAGYFAIEAVFGKNELVCRFQFPIPVDKTKIKSRIARKSSYIEVITPLPDPETSSILADFVFPSVLDLSTRVPVTLNIPHLSLDTLPILSVAEPKSIGWLNTLASFTFSAREKRLRKATQSAPDATGGFSASTRLNFKESLFTLFMVASGLQGGQTGLFALDHPQRGGIHALIFVSALRLDGANGSVVADAAVLPFTVDLVTGGAVETFLLLLRSLECCSLKVDDGELELWKRALPALAERCRTWSHGEKCEYKRPRACIPLSVEHGKPVLCSCGQGKLPPAFTGLPEWETAARFATRVAISPTFAVPFVEELVDAAELGRAAATLKSSSSAAAADVQGLGGQVGAMSLSACRNCGAGPAKNGGQLKKCARCREVAYCSVECQKKDWKKHRMECKELE